jgi:hypothetical protein
MQRSVPSGLSYSQKPKAKRRKWLMKNEVKDWVLLTWKFSIGTFNPFPINYITTVLRKKNWMTNKMRIMTYLKHSFDHNIRCSIGDTPNKYGRTCLRSNFLQQSIRSKKKSIDKPFHCLLFSGHHWLAYRAVVLTSKQWQTRHI